MLRRSLLVVGLLVVAPIAHAQPTPGDATQSPAFVSIDRFDATSAAGIDFTYLSLENAGDTTVVRTWLAARYVDPASRTGGYMQLPITYASGNDESEIAIGNFELGGILVPKVGDASTGLVLHAGITLPTASTELEGAFVNLFGAFARPSDIYLALPGATSLRVGASPMLRSGNVFARFDVGLDVNLDIRDSDEKADPILRLNAGIGVDLGTVALMGELSNVYVFNDNDEADFGDRMINQIALSVRGHGGKVMPFGAIVLPLDDDSNEVIDFAVTFGVESKL